ncbi:hypothetical protein AJ80_07493 [Polytolypa hystricis UAMH7299]|uniref:BTB domain-containing protein n=1 Tax=Polytolypa hystricis (strain UAMH7299) TaxID=1447883 RepID=A0A2B7XPW6_POLH7|nr:hypothetical protein AJ80_07493 [Polytolypa hystricis UAMH7299]
MKHDIYLVDPEGDVELVVKPGTTTLSEEEALFEDPPTPRGLQWPQQQPLDTTEDSPPIKPTTIRIRKVRDLSGRYYESFSDGMLWHADQSSGGDRVEDDQNSEAGPSGLDLFDDLKARIRVSSKHLKLASAYFRRQLEGDWRESHDLKSKGFVEIPVLGDFHAIVILMNVIHGYTRKVPRSVDLNMLTNMAILVDYYEFHEAVEVLTEMWIGNLEQSLPTTYSPDLVKWVSISFVFRKKDIFQKMTTIAQRHAKSAIQTLNLPILYRVIDEIDLRRRQSLSRIVSALHNLIVEFRKDSIPCKEGNTFECNSMLLGTLTKEMESRGLLHCDPELASFDGISFEVMVTSIRNIRSSQWASVRRTHHNDHYYNSPRSHSCQLGSHIIPFIESLEPSMCGLNLDDFLPKEAI